MEPNFHDREYILVNQLSYRLESPRRGDTIIFKYPKDTTQEYIKRIIGLPNENVEISDGQVKINGRLIDENFLSPGQKTIINNQERFQITLNNHEYFVMGDNRDHSSDSREFGPLERKYFIGKAWFVVYPFKKSGIVKRPEMSIINNVLFGYFNKALTFSSET